MKYKEEYLEILQPYLDSIGFTIVRSYTGNTWLLINKNKKLHLEYMSFDDNMQTFGNINNIMYNVDPNDRMMRYFNIVRNIIRKHLIKDIIC